MCVNSCAWHIGNIWEVLAADMTIVMNHFPKVSVLVLLLQPQTQWLETTVMSYIAHEPLVWVALDSESSWLLQHLLGAASLRDSKVVLAVGWELNQAWGLEDSVALHVGLSMRPELPHSMVAVFPGDHPQRESCVDAILPFMTQYWNPHSISCWHNVASAIHN